MGKNEASFVTDEATQKLGSSAGSLTLKNRCGSLRYPGCASFRAPNAGLRARDETVLRFTCGTANRHRRPTTGRLEQLLGSIKCYCALRIHRRLGREG